MNTGKIVHLLRHGQVDNPHGILYGRTPGYHLSPLGRTMAERAAEVTAEWKLTWLGSSPLERARETLAPIAALRPELETHIDERFIEADNHFAGSQFSFARIARDPKNWKYLRNPLRPSWGEPYDILAARMTAAILSVAEQIDDGQQALAVSHQLPIWIARLRAEGMRLAHNPAHRECSLASITTFEVRDGMVTCEGYRETSEDLLDDALRRSPISTSRR